MESKYAQCVILAGGLGSRMHELTASTPKPLVLANGEPLLRHVIRIYERQGIRRFVVLAGYLSDKVHVYFASLLRNGEAITYSGSNKDFHPLLSSPTERLSVTVVETGIETQTAGRLRLAENYLDETFFLSYGDSFADVDLETLSNQHRFSKNLVTITAVKPPSRFGTPVMEGDRVVKFQEKTDAHAEWISGGFMLIDKKVIKFIDSFSSSLEMDILPSLATQGLVGVHKHTGQFFAVDSVRDLKNFEEYLRRVS